MVTNIDLMNNLSLPNLNILEMYEKFNNNFNLNKLVSKFNLFSKGPGILIGTTSGGFIYENYDHKTVCIISGVVFIVSCVTKIC